MLKRKIYDKLVEWKNSSNGTTALLIEGARRIGKSFIVEEFAKNNYASYILIDFSKMNDNFKEVFDDLQNIDEFYKNLFLSLQKSPLPKNSLIIFDEVQFCPKARQAIKHLVFDGRYHFIETGSLVSIKENTMDILIPSEEERISMYPLDYEEFLWAINKEYECEVLKEIYDKRDTKTSLKMHQVFIKTLRLYMAIGGMPQVVNKYIETNDFYAVEKTKKNILSLYEEDLKKIDNKYNTICYLVYKSIPSMLSKHTTRFITSSINERADSVLFKNTLSKLIESKMVNVVYRCNEPKIGFSLTIDDAFFKIYFNDIGLFTSMVYSENINESRDIYQRLILDKVDTNLGMLYENLVCQMLICNNHIPYYYSWKDKNKENMDNKNSKSYELDFIIYKKGHVIPIEVKSSLIKSLASLNAFKDKYGKGVGEKIIIKNKPLNYGDNTTYLPIYLTFNL